MAKAPPNDSVGLFLFQEHDMDTPKDNLYLAPRKTAGITYANGGAQEYGLAAAGLKDVINDILKKAGRPV